MTEHMDKTQLLNEIRTSYANFEAVLASLSTEQMITPGVNGTWSIKDNIAHLSTWQRVLLNRLEAVHNNTTPSEELYDEETVDAVNERFYQQDKPRSLDDVLTEFRSLYQQVVEQVQAISDEDLNRPLSWREGEPIWPTIVGNTNEHYQEHMQIIQNWLTKHNS
ncbi:MAG TPA: ClbS/DfsB family four-helix bundle protein [Ktedonobacteraceae bacterium]|nr:ClbS/DfsB family four-helix bundle protein [Ktedonobacteraceae bacterium]